MAKTSDYQFGKFEYPRGWFMIAAADELADAPVPLRYFGQDLVLYRGQSGTAHLVSAYCPHRGAHLATNTTNSCLRSGEQIEGESIRCPFHGLRFGPDGKCDHVPNSDFVPPTARLQTFPVLERAGIIWMWNDPEGLEPEYPVPDFGGHYDEAGWVNWKIDHLGDLDLHGCEVVDNMADLGHMGPIHGAQRCLHFSNEFRKHVVYQYFKSEGRPFGELPAATSELDTWYTGPGILESEMNSHLPGFMVLANTPIEDGRTRMWLGVMVRMGDGSRSLTGQELAIARAYQDQMRIGLMQDVEIWASKRSCINPLSIPADGPYGKLRSWYKQFYNDRATAALIQSRVDGTIVSLDEPATKELLSATTG